MKVPKSKKLITVSLDPAAWREFQNLVEKRDGPKQASPHLEGLVVTENARLAGRVAEVTAAFSSYLRETAEGLGNADLKKDLERIAASLDVWTEQASSLNLIVAEAKANYADLQKRYRQFCKQSGDLVKALTEHNDHYTDLKDLAKGFGLDLNSDFGNADKVIGKLLAAAAEPTWEYGKEDLQLFINRSR